MPLFWGARWRFARGHFCASPAAISCRNCSFIPMTASNFPLPCWRVSPWPWSSSSLRPDFLESLFGAQVFHHGLGAGMDMQLFINRPHVTPHGINADLHAVGNFLVSIAIGQLVEELLLTGGQQGNRRGLFCRSHEKLDNAAGELRGHGSAARVNIADGLEQARGGGALEQ